MFHPCCRSFQSGLCALRVGLLQKDDLVYSSRVPVAAVVLVAVGLVANTSLCSSSPSSEIATTRPDAKQMSLSISQIIKLGGSDTLQWRKARACT